MENMFVSESYENNSNILYIRENISPIIFKNSKDEIVHDLKRVAINFDIEEKIFRLAFNDIADKIADVIAIKYKYAFFEEKIKVVGLESINKEILITALISADFYEDKKYILSKFRGFNKIAIDGFFNFRLDGLKKKWSEICTFIPDFFTEREIKEFVMYLLNEKCARGVKVDGNKVFDKLGNRLNRASLLPNSSLLVFKELLLAGAKEIEIFSLPNEELEQKYLKEYFGDKIFFNSGEIL